MKLSENFTLKEFTNSEKAVELGIENIPNNEEVENILELVKNVLQPLRNKIGKPIIINSGYRCELLNNAVGGEQNSQHRKGQAADIIVDGLTPQELFTVIKDNIEQYDQLIAEPTWVHVSYNKGHNRKQLLKAIPMQMVNGKTKYVYKSVE